MALPVVLADLQAHTRALGFLMASEELTGSLLRTLAASKPEGALLELGTGTGIATAWLLDGMSAAATLDSVDSDPETMAVARKYLGDDPRLRLHLADAGDYLATLACRQFDLLFADTWIGKYRALEAALALLAPGAFYVVDDLLPQPEWSAEHRSMAGDLLSTLHQRSDLHVCRLDWATGLVIATRRF